MQGAFDMVSDGWQVNLQAVNLQHKGLMFILPNLLCHEIGSFSQNFGVAKVPLPTLPCAVLLFAEV